MREDVAGPVDDLHGQRDRHALGGGTGHGRAGAGQPGAVGAGGGQRGSHAKVTTASWRSPSQRQASPSAHARAPGRCSTAPAGARLVAGRRRARSVPPTCAASPGSRRGSAPARCPSRRVTRATSVDRARRRRRGRRAPVCGGSRARGRPASSAISMAVSGPLPPGEALVAERLRRAVPARPACRRRSRPRASPWRRAGWPRTARRPGSAGSTAGQSRAGASPGGRMTP